MLSKSDIRKLVEVFATRDEVKQEIERLEGKMITRDQFDQVFNMLDQVMGEVKDIRQEQTVHAHQHEETREKIGKIEERVDKIEQSI